jgi:hypothetical protein
LFAKQLNRRNLEQALSRIRRIAALLKDSDAVAGTEDSIEGLTAAVADKLDELVCQAIVKELDTSGADLKPMLDFAAWAARTDYHSPLEIFTVNYDLLLERALEEWEVAYFDGFIGTLTARFRTELVEPLPGAPCMPGFFVRLWKIHGSLNWEWDERHKILRRGNLVHSSAAIYPSDTKYDESRRIPFVVLQDRFRRALHQAETLTLISGYSFGDEHLNEVIYDAASRRERSEIIVFCHSTIPAELAERAARTPNIQVLTGEEAIIGGVRDCWEKPQEEMPADFWVDDRFAFRDFKYLAAYLAKSVSREEDHPIASTLPGSTFPGSKLPAAKLPASKIPAVTLPSAPIGPPTAQSKPTNA